MNIRTRLLIGYGGFVLALAVLGGWSARTLSQMSAVSSRIIAENYDSVIAAQDMKESLERQDSAAAFELLGHHERSQRQVGEHRARFDAALAKAAGNITESGEAEVVETIRRERDAYYRLFDEFLSAPGDRTQHYFDVLEPRFNAVRAECDRLLHLNQEAMRRKADAASGTARRWFYVTLVLAVVLMGVGVGVEIRLSAAILTPVRALTAATTKMAAGELDVSVPVKSTDEVGVLAEGFNRMAGRIRELRQSDRGQLLVAQQTAEAAIDALREPVIVTDSHGGVTRVNAAAERLLGRRAEIVGQPIDVVARDTPIARAVTAALDPSHTRTSQRTDETLPWPVDGAPRAFRVRSTPMRDADRQVVGAVTLLEDVTHLDELSRVKSEFLAAASRTFRTPLTNVQLALHLLLEGAAGALEARQQEILEGCRDDAEQLDRAMRELLAVSNATKELATRRPVRPSVIARDVADSLRLEIEAKGLRFDVDVPPDLPVVRVDREQMVQALTHLIVNALQNTPSGGKITLAGSLSGDLVSLAVTDTGPGIPRHVLSSIFEPFVQVPGGPHGGAGLGLTIVRRVAEAHGGSVTARSDLGHGATFIVSIPAGDRSQPESDPDTKY